MTDTLQIRGDDKKVKELFQHFEEAGDATAKRAASTTSKRAARK